jgi:tetratricopeptide (TPR) repeat protein
MEYWRIQPEELFSSLASSKDGLSSKEAKLRLQKYGTNELEPPDRKTIPRILTSQFQNPLIYILIIATIIAFILGDTTEALIIFAIVFVNALLGFVQEYRSEKALEELRKAEECDPLDSTPHQLASAIYNDLYMPVESIEEAKKVLELLPYRKASGEALLEGAQNGTMSVNYGLDVLDLPEWSLFASVNAPFL